ncbi:hypothetical protein [Glaciihabitans sp. dw_435]|uniref:hypothetical protein n=1 Tax=Glaciihabitans sp. dw_435 TaxID=2720081 RepID=UPI0027DC0EFB|nr:hypothetical protein [Glaciihabitans sp. dw_435]
MSRSLTSVDLAATRTSDHGRSSPVATTVGVPTARTGPAASVGAGPAVAVVGGRDGGWRGRR